MQSAADSPTRGISRWVQSNPARSPARSPALSYSTAPPASEHPARATRGTKTRGSRRVFMPVTLLDNAAA
nr:MAG TPA: hypothetical protein [Caudoviricetes sp.]